MVESTDKHGVFEFRPLEPGFATTIGNALRRVLLSSLEGYAITSIRIEGVQHELAPIHGVIEDVADMVQRFKQVRFKQQIPGETFEKVNVVIGGQDKFVAGDINKFLSVFQVLNPELVICHMDPSVKLSIELTINKGRGYVNADENKVLNAPIDTIAIDSIHTPIRNVSFKYENYRVEQKTDYEKLKTQSDTDLDSESGTDYAVWFGAGDSNEPDGHNGKFSFKGKMVAHTTGGGVNEVVGVAITIAPSTPITFE